MLSSFVKFGDISTSAIMPAAVPSPVWLPSTVASKESAPMGRSGTVSRDWPHKEE
jgi:hypothetical protein